MKSNLWSYKAHESTWIGQWFQIETFCCSTCFWVFLSFLHFLTRSFRYSALVIPFREPEWPKKFFPVFCCSRFAKSCSACGWPKKVSFFLFPNWIAFVVVVLDIINLQSSTFVNRNIIFLAIFGANNFILNLAWVAKILQLNPSLTIQAASRPRSLAASQPRGLAASALASIFFKAEKILV